MSLNEDILKILACPKCMGDLRIIGPDGVPDGAPSGGLACAACKLVYPVENDVPVLLIEAARPLTLPLEE